MATGRVRAVQDLRRSNAAGTHQDRRTGRNRARGQQEQVAIGEQMDDVDGLGNEEEDRG